MGAFEIEVEMLNVFETECEMATNITIMKEEAQTSKIFVFAMAEAL